MNSAEAYEKLEDCRNDLAAIAVEINSHYQQLQQHYLQLQQIAKRVSEIEANMKEGGRDN